MAATEIAGEIDGGVNIKMGKIIRLSAYRKERQAQKIQDRRRSIHSGFAFADTALQIMLEEAAKRGHTDRTAIWYACARASIEGLRQAGWTEQELIKTILVQD